MQVPVVPLKHRGTVEMNTITDPTNPSRNLYLASYSLTPTTQHTVSFSEYPTGTIDPTYFFLDNEVSFFGTIDQDWSQPDSPALWPRDGATGSIYISLSNPVAHVELDAGYFNNINSTVVEFVGTDGALLQSFFNSQFGVQHFSCDNATGISSVNVINYSYDVNGFTVDNFTFGGPVIPADISAPTVTSFSPADDASGVGIADNIYVAFNETITRGNGSILLKETNGRTVETWNAGDSSNLAIFGNSLVIDPSYDLTYGVDYRIEFAAGAVKDLAGNEYAGTTTYNFTIEQPPVSHQPLLVSAVNLAARAYSDAHYNDPKKINLVNQSVASWVPLNQTDLGYAADDPAFHQPGGSVLRYDNLNASASTGLSMLDGKMTLGISFEGTNTSGWQSVADIKDDISDIDSHFDKLEAFAQRVAAFANEPGHHIDQILVSGHSLGGAMAQKFMNEFGRSDSRYIGVTFGSPGTLWGISLPNERFVNFVHDGDPVPKGGTVHLYHVEGSTITVAADASGFMSEHNLFFADGSNTLGEGVSYHNSIEFLSENLSKDILFGGHDITVGTNATDELHGSVVYGLADNDKMYGSSRPWPVRDWFQGGPGDDEIHGGFGKDTASFNGVRSDYTIVTSNFMGNAVAKVFDNNPADGDDGTDYLESVEICRFADKEVTLHYPVSGIIVDGYVAGANIYIDDNGNGLADIDENTGALSDAQGKFAFETTLSGSIIAVGGTNIDTGLPNQLALIAPEGSAVVTPLTTLIQIYAIQSGQTISEAETAVQTALGIDGKIDLTQYNPLGQATVDATALSVQRAAAQMAEVGNAALKAGKSFESIAFGLADSIVAGQSLDLADRSQLQMLLGNDSENTVLNAAVATNQAISIAESIQSISTIQLNASHGNGGSPPEDILPPTVTAFYPINNATDVSPNSNIVLAFSENIALGNGSIVIRNASTGATVAAYDAATSRNLILSGNTLIINPTSNLAYNTSYSLEFGDGTIKDLVGNNFAGTTNYRFTTATTNDVDTTPPVILNLSPADEAAGVQLDVDIVITFSETIQRGSGLVVIKNTSTGTPVDSYDASTSNKLSFSGNTLIINPTADLAYNTNYSVEFGDGTIKDLVGNNFVGTTSFNFTTTASAVDSVAPTISTFNPADEATGVPLASDIVITFSEPVQRGSGFIMLKNKANGATVATYEAASSSNLLISGNLLTINPSTDLAYNTDYRVEFGYGTIKDLAGNNFPGTSNYNFSATTYSIITGTNANDVLFGGTGDDSINGGPGIDTSSYRGVRSNFQISYSESGWRLIDLIGVEGIDTLTNVERLSFADKRFALDLAPTESAGLALEFIGMMAPNLIKTPTVVGSILAIFDEGASMRDVCEMALDVGLVTLIAGSDSNSDLAAMVFRNLTGAEADTSTVDRLVAYMDGRTESFGQAEFMAAVAELELNQVHIGLTGIQQTGIAYG